MEDDDDKMIFSPTETRIIEECIKEEPHTEFISVPVTTVKEELLEEEFSDNQLVDESDFPNVSSVVKEEYILGIESLHVPPSPSTEEEFITEELQYGQEADLCPDMSVETCIEDMCHENQTNGTKQIEFTTSQGLCVPRAFVKKEENTTKTFDCDLCNKNFAQARYLARHKLRHLGIKAKKSTKKFQCDVCNKYFSRRCHLTRHKLIHSGIKEYQCDVCNKYFMLSGHLARHKLIHSGIKKYQCDECSKLFTQSYHLTQHKLIHNKKYQCDVCNKTFSIQRYLSRHVKTHKRNNKNVNIGQIEEMQADICNS